METRDGCILTAETARLVGQKRRREEKRRRAARPAASARLLGLFFRGVEHAVFVLAVIGRTELAELRLDIKISSPKGHLAPPTGVSREKGAAERGKGRRRVKKVHKNTTITSGCNREARHVSRVDLFIGTGHS